MRVLVTRPEPGASQTSEKLRRAGHEPVVLPLTTITGLDPAPGQLSADTMGAIAVTSTSAIRQWQQLGIEPECLERPIYVVGERTGRVARTAGFRDVRIGAGTGNQLASLIDLDSRSRKLQPDTGKPLVYVAGEVRNPDFERDLSQTLVPIRVVNIYTVNEISYSTDYLSEFFLTHPVDVVLLYSSVASDLFFKKTSQLNIDKYLKICSYLCMSRAISEKIPKCYASQIRVAASPDEQSLLSLLGDNNAQL